MEGRRDERRSDPRRGIAVRVGLALTATGIVSLALDRRALAGVVPDWRTAVAFGLFALLLFIAGFQRPPRGATQLAFAALATVLVLTSLELGTTPAMLEYVALALAAAYYAAEHLRPLVVGAFALWTPALWLLGGRPLSPVLWIACLLALALAAFALLDPRRVHPSDRLRRAGYATLAVALVGASVARTLVVSGPGSGIIDGLTLVVAVALPALAYARMPSRTRELIAAALALVAFAAIGSAYVAATPYQNDAVVGPHRAAQLLLAGEDPYASFDLTEALRHFGIDTEFATHLEDGTQLHTYSYPAVSFLVVAPFVALGLADIRWLYLLEALLIAAITARHLRPAWRAPAFATIVGNEIVARQTVISGIDPTWALLAILAWIVRDRPWPSAILLGLAVADRQPAWLLLPFFLVAVARHTGARDALRYAAIAVGVAFAIHVPFLIGAPSRTLEGVLAPVFAPLVSDGVGLMQFGVTDRYTTILPRAAYTVLALGALAALLWLAWRRPRPLAGAVLGWAVLPLYFAWRSLQNYFTFSPLLSLVGDEELADEVSPRPVGAPLVPRTSPRSRS